MGEDKTEGKSLWSLLMQNKETEISHTWLPNKLLDPSHFGLLISCTSLTKISQNHPKVSNKSSKVHPQPEHWPPQVLWIQWAATSAAADRFTVLPASFRALCAAWLPALLWLGAKKNCTSLHKSTANESYKDGVQSASSPGCQWRFKLVPVRPFDTWSDSLNNHPLQWRSLPVHGYIGWIDVEALLRSRGYADWCRSI